MQRLTVSLGVGLEKETMRLEPTRLLSASPVVPPRREVHGFTALCVYTSRDGPMGPAGLLRGRALHPPYPVMFT